MADSYSRLAATATRLINKYGREFSLRSYVSSGSAYDPSLTPSDQTVKGVFVSASQDDVNQGLVQKGDKFFLMASAIRPDESMKVVDKSNTYEISNVVFVEPGDTLLISKVQIRR